MPEIYVRKVAIIQEQFVKALQIHLSQCVNGPRLSDILTWLTMLHQSSSVLLQSKMFYVPFLICKRPEPMSGIPSISPTLNNSLIMGQNTTFKIEHEQHEETDSEENYEKGSTSTTVDL